MGYNGVMQKNFDYCAALVREADRDRYLATLFAPAEHRDGLFALYAFNVEIAQVRDKAREPLPGEIRLQWWREMLEGVRDGEAAANPVAAALRETLERYGFVASAAARTDRCPPVRFVQRADGEFGRSGIIRHPHAIAVIRHGRRNFERRQGDAGVVDVRRQRGLWHRRRY